MTVVTYFYRLGTYEQGVNRVHDDICNGKYIYIAKDNNIMYISFNAVAIIISFLVIT